MVQIHWFVNNFKSIKNHIFLIILLKALISKLATLKFWKHQHIALESYAQNTNGKLWLVNEINKPTSVFYVRPQSLIFQPSISSSQRLLWQRKVIRLLHLLSVPTPLPQLWLQSPWLPSDWVTSAVSAHLSASELQHSPAASVTVGLHCWSSFLRLGTHHGLAFLILSFCPSSDDISCSCQVSSQWWPGHHSWI